MDLLLKELKDAPCFVISFDESFNEVLEKEQTDFIVRYFKDGEVKCKYLSSGFLGHTTAKDLKRAFEECTEKLELENLIQVSMDGPNINRKMLDLIVEDRNSNETYPNLLDVGSCSLHVVHGAFRTGMKQTGWGIDLLSKSLYSHLHETPARREDYTKMTGSEVFPLQFCGHRWLEDKRVAERAVEMWPSLTTYITEILKSLRVRSLLQFIFNCQICCLEQIDNCKTGVFHVNSSCYEAIPTNISVSWASSAFHHL